MSLYCGMRNEATKECPLWDSPSQDVSPSWPWRHIEGPLHPAVGHPTTLAVSVLVSVFAVRHSSPRGFERVVARRVVC